MRFGWLALASLPPSAPVSAPASTPPEPASVPLVQAVEFVDEHWPQAPETSHAGVAPLQSESEPQGSQTPAALQTGV